LVNLIIGIRIAVQAVLQVAVPPRDHRRTGHPILRATADVPSPSPAANAILARTANPVRVGEQACDAGRR
jgi:hypothetical protein